MSTLSTTTANRTISRTSPSSVQSPTHFGAVSISALTILSYSVFLSKTYPFSSLLTFNISIKFSYRYKAWHRILWTNPLLAKELIYHFLYKSKRFFHTLLINRFTLLCNYIFLYNGTVLPMLIILITLNCYSC